MTRPAGDSRERLLEAGKSLIQEKGFSGLSVRAVAARAGLNQGLLSYHFGGKEAFLRKVIQGIYEDFFKDFSLQVEGESDPLSALRKGLLRFSRFIRDHRSLVRGMIRDALNGDRHALGFGKDNFPRHGLVLAALVAKCQKKGRLADLPLPLVMSTLMSALVMPTLVADVFVTQKKPSWTHVTPALVNDSLLTDKALERRVDLALKALKP